MSELETILNQLKTKPNCKVGNWFDRQDPKLATTINNALEHSTRHLIYKALVKMGMDVSSSSFYRHINQECSCTSQS
jgi:hypothetical protein